MATLLRRLWCALWICCGLGFPVLAQAYGQLTGLPTTPVTKWRHCQLSNGTCKYDQGYIFSSPSAACTGYQSAWNAANPVGYATCTLTSPTSCSCALKRKDNNASLGTQGVNIQSTVVQESVTPAGATCSGGTCTCGTGMKPTPTGDGCQPYTCSTGPALNGDGEDLYGDYVSPGLSSSVSVCGVNAAGDHCIANAAVVLRPGTSKSSAGGWNFNGSTCTQTASDQAVLAQLSEPKTCPPGQVVIGDVNGTPVCGTSPSQVSTTVSTTRQPDGTVTQTTEQTECGSSSCVTKTTTTITPADGSASSTTSTTTTGPKDDIGRRPTTTYTVPDTDAPTDPDGAASAPPAICELDPSAPECGGTLAPIDPLRVQGERTIGDAMSDLSTRLRTTPIGGLVSDFFDLDASVVQCPVFEAQIPYLDYHMVIDQYCTDFASNALSLLRSTFLLVCTFFAFRVAFQP